MSTALTIAAVVAVAYFLRGHARRINQLEEHMSTTDDKIAHLDAAATETGVRVNTLTSTVRQLTDRLAELEPGAAETEQVKADLAKALAAIDRNADYLTALGSDPANPVPDVPDEADPGTDGPLMEGDPFEQQV